MYLYGKTPFRVKRLKFSSDKLENSRYNIRSLSLLRKDANLSKLEARNLNKFINCNTFSFLVLLTCLVNEIYFSLVISKINASLRSGNFFDDEMRVVAR